LILQRIRIFIFFLIFIVFTFNDHSFLILVLSILYFCIG
jgi:hypothetical protein